MLTLLQTANSDIHINPLTGSEDDRPIWDAYLSVANVIYHQFRTSPSPRVKYDLLEEMRALQESRHSGPLQAVDTHGVSPAVVYANMIRKIGSEQEFEAVLKDAFDSCYTALTDGEEWNDVHTLCLLAKILASVGGLEKEAQIAFSAQFSDIDPYGESEEELIKAEEKEKEDAEARKAIEAETKTVEEAETPTTKETDAENPVDEDDPNFDSSSSASDSDGFDDSDSDAEDRWGDISSFSAFYCRCGSTYIQDWSHGPLYLCLLCTDVKLCAKCHAQLALHNDATAVAAKHKQPSTTSRGNGPEWTHWTLYCGQNHKYIKGPVEGWRGIRNGKMLVDGQKVSFRKWLREIKDVKWPNAWREFWMREDSVIDIL
jgi:hypothetical protein